MTHTFRPYLSTTGKRISYVIRNTAVNKPYNTVHKAFVDDENNVCILNGGCFPERIADLLRAGTHQIVSVNFDNEQD